MRMYEFVIAALLAVFASPAFACGGPTTNKVCYSRNYDLTDLAKHPFQRVIAMRIALSPDPYEFAIDVQFREDKEKWSWGASGMCFHYGPGMSCSVIVDGCEASRRTGTDKHFYITKNQNSLYLYPNKIELGTVKDDQTILTEGRDDKVFRLDKAACWDMPAVGF
jgi:hypothetical protein